MSGLFGAYILPMRLKFWLGGVVYLSKEEVVVAAGAAVQCCAGCSWLYLVPPSFNMPQLVPSPDQHQVRDLMWRGGPDGTALSGWADGMGWDAAAGWEGVCWHVRVLALIAQYHCHPMFCCSDSFTNGGSHWYN